jgi:hypothetical protein
MIILLAALAATASPLTHFDHQKRVCEERVGDNFVEYAGCVVEASAVEQRMFEQLIALAIRNHRISKRTLGAWSRERDRRCKKEADEIPNINMRAVGQAVCIARADDRLLRSLKLKRG